MKKHIALCLSIAAVITIVSIAALSTLNIYTAHMQKEQISIYTM